jgi:hypothetical protein
MMSPSFNNSVSASKYYTIASRGHSEEGTGNQCEVNTDYGVLHRRKLIVPDILPKGSKFNQLYFSMSFSGFERANPNFRRQIGKLTSWVHTDDSLYHNESKCCRNSRRIIFYDCLTHPIRQTSALVTLVL